MKKIFLFFLWMFTLSITQAQNNSLVGFWRTDIARVHLKSNNEEFDKIVGEEFSRELGEWIKIGEPQFVELICFSAEGYYYTSLYGKFGTYDTKGGLFSLEGKNFGSYTFEDGRLLLSIYFLEPFLKLLQDGGIRKFEVLGISDLDSLIIEHINVDIYFLPTYETFDIDSKK